MAEPRSLSRTVQDPLRPLARVALDATVWEATRMMYECGTDAVAVVDGQDRVVGIFTAHDVVGVLGLGYEPKTTVIFEWLRSPRQCNHYAPRGEAWFG